MSRIYWSIDDFSVNNDVNTIGVLINDKKTLDILNGNKNMMDLPHTEAKYYTAVGMYYDYVKDNEKCIGFYELAQSMLTDAFDKEIVNTVIALHHFRKSNFSKSQRLIDQAVDSGVNAAYHLKGLLYVKSGMMKEAEDMFQIGADNMDVRSMHELGKMLMSKSENAENPENPENPVNPETPKNPQNPQNETKKDDAIRYFQLASDLGYPYSMIEMAKIYQKAGKESLTIGMYERAIDTGSRYGLYMAAKYYEIYSGKECIGYYEMAINKGSLDALVSLGVYLYNTEQYDMAIKYLEMGAIQDIPQCSAYLGLYYYKNSSSKATYGKNLIHKAANMGDAVAMIMCLEQVYVTTAEDADAYCVYANAILDTGICDDITEKHIDLAERWIKCLIQNYPKASEKHIMNFAKHCGSIIESLPSHLITTELAISASESFPDAWKHIPADVDIQANYQLAEFGKYNMIRMLDEGLFDAVTKTNNSITI
jgi:TPR repeat protein